ncbi:MAG: hypothetical protein LC776_04140 [Acidobacteria bacterium]|nr:hypothetical protein [Acidobacteriota bacterium]
MRDLLTGLLFLSSDKVERKLSEQPHSMSLKIRSESWPNLRGQDEVISLRRLLWHRRTSTGLLSRCGRGLSFSTMWSSECARLRPRLLNNRETLLAELINKEADLAYAIKIKQR